MRTTLSGFHPGRARFYLGDQIGPVVVITNPGSAPSAVVFYETKVHLGRVLATRGLETSDIVSVLVENWHRGGEHAERARTALCEPLLHLARDTRREGEKEFAQAVAVSADAKKTIVADWVVVFSDVARDKPMRLFAAASFAEEKVHIPRSKQGGGHRMSTYRVDVTEGELLQAAGLSCRKAELFLGNSLLLDVETTDRKHFLYAPERYCPTLPAREAIILPTKPSPSPVRVARA